MFHKKLIMFEKVSKYTNMEDIIFLNPKISVDLIIDTTLRGLALASYTYLIKMSKRQYTFKIKLLNKK